MKIVIRAIKPYWLYLIIIGKKTVEISKSRPMDELWNRTVALYCSKDLKSLRRIPKEDRIWMAKYLGKIACSFKCEKIDKIEIIHFTVLRRKNLYTPVSYDPDYLWLKHSCLTYDEVVAYGKGAPLYAWHVSNLKVSPVGAPCPGRPPQSWKYHFTDPEE